MLLVVSAVYGLRPGRAETVRRVEADRQQYILQVLLCGMKGHTLVASKRERERFFFDEQLRPAGFSVLELVAA